MVQHWVVAFLDLLGQRAALRKMDFLPDEDDREKVQALIAAVRDSVGVINGFFKLYDEFDSGAEQSSLSDAFKDLPPEAQALAREWRSTQPRKARFSDGMAVYNSLVPSPENSPVKAFYDLVCASGSLMLMSLAWGHPIRGGIDVGTGVEVEVGQLHGPAVVKAYELESRTAGYPRIVVGPTAVQYLNAIVGAAGDGPRSQLDSHLADVVRGMLCQDGDGQNIVDYMGRRFKEKVSGVVDRKMIHAAEQFVAAELARFSAENQKTLYARYERLSNYFEKRVDVWV